MSGGAKMHNEFAPDTFEEEIVKLKSSISDDSKFYCDKEQAYLEFIGDRCLETLDMFKKGKFKKTFIRLKYLEDLLYVIVRALNRTLHKQRDGINLEGASARIAQAIHSIYGSETVEILKDWMRRPEDETVLVELDQILKINWVSPHSQQFQDICSHSQLSLLIRHASWIYNQKGIVALT